MEIQSFVDIEHSEKKSDPDTLPTRLDAVLAEIGALSQVAGDSAKEVGRLRDVVSDIQKDYQEKIVELQMSVRALEILILSKV